MKEHILLRIYLAGYAGQVMPRWLRKLLAGSEIHRAWLMGFTGCFEENGVRYGPSTRAGQLPAVLER